VYNKAFVIRQPGTKINLKWIRTY